MLRNVDDVTAPCFTTERTSCSSISHIFVPEEYHNSEMVFDPSDPTIDETQFGENDWTATEFGLNMEEEITLNMPAPRGLGSHIFVPERVP